VSGKGRIEVGAEAGVEHRFYAIEEDLTVLLFFAPPSRCEHGQFSFRADDPRFARADVSGRL
jgi:hypothetical protein